MIPIATPQTIEVRSHRKTRVSSRIRVFVNLAETLVCRSGNPLFYLEGTHNTTQHNTPTMTIDQHCK